MAKKRKYNEDHIVHGSSNKKLRNFLLSALCLVLGLLIGVFGNIFLSLPDSYKIPSTRKSSSGSSTDISAGAIDTEVIKNSDVSIHFLELGNKFTGDCIYIKIKRQGKDDIDILIDGGSKSSSVPYITSYVDKYLTDNVLDFVIITHAHEDHYAGYAVRTTEDATADESIFDHYRLNGKSIANVITFAKSNKGNASPASIHGKYLKELGEVIASGANHYTALDCYKSDDNTLNEVYDTSSTANHDARRFYNFGQDSNGDDVKIQFLYTNFYEDSSKTENNYSVCFQLIQGEKRYLFTGDLEELGEESLVAKTENGLSHVELFKAGHHGSKTSSSETLMNAVSPSVVVVCCCAGSSEYTTKNENQFPTQEFVNNVSIYTSKIYVTSLCIDFQANEFQSFNGTVVVCVTGGGSVQVQCSNNSTVLKDTEWFKNNRTLPTGAKN